MAGMREAFGPLLTIAWIGNRVGLQNIAAVRRSMQGPEHPHLERR
jgi:hypothetical protein